MRRHETLPGVEARPVPPRVVFDSAAIVRQARRMAALRDSAQLLLLGAVDYMFTLYPGTHVPFLNRPQSAGLLAGVNAAVICGIAAARWLPRLRSKHIASTWGPDEQEKFRKKQ